MTSAAAHYPRGCKSMVLIRIRVRFDFTPVSYARKCWFVFDPEQCRLVKDVAYLISSHFDLQSCQERNGIELYMDDYLIPANERSQIIRDNDVIEVKTTQVPHVESSKEVSVAEDQPKAKRRKKTKKTKKKESTTKYVSPVTSTPNTSAAINNHERFTPLPEPPRPLRSVTTKSASGGVHTKFHGSSSSSSSSSESEPERQSSTLKPTASQKQQKRLNLLSESKQQPVRSSKLPKVNGKTPPASKQLANKSRVAVSNDSSTTRGIRRRNIPFHVITGGPSDVHTTRSEVYQWESSSNGGVKITSSPRNNKKQSTNSRDAASATASDKTSEALNTVDDTQQVTVDTSSSEVVRDYSVLSELQGPPRVGDKLAFKLLELTSSCTPEVSDYKEGEVLSYDVATKLVRVKYNEATLRRLNKGSDGPGILDKFILDSGEEGESLNADPGADTADTGVVELTLDSLIQPKLIV